MTYSLPFRVLRTEWSLVLCPGGGALLVAVFAFPEQVWKTWDFEELHKERKSFSLLCFWTFLYDIKLENIKEQFRHKKQKVALSLRCEVADVIPCHHQQVLLKALNQFPVLSVISHLDSQAQICALQKHFHLQQKQRYHYKLDLSSVTDAFHLPCSICLCLCQTGSFGWSGWSSSLSICCRPSADLHGRRFENWKSLQREM